jgi:uncharacterized protein (TIGR00288 family)
MIKAARVGKRKPDYAVLVDVENINRRCAAYSIVDSTQKFGSRPILRAFGNWKHSGSLRLEYENAGFETISPYSDHAVHKNFTDMQLTVDAVELAFFEPQIGTFIVASNDADFVPLFSKLKSFGRRTVSIGGALCSNRLREIADEAIRLNPVASRSLLADQGVAEFLGMVAETLAGGRPVYLAGLANQVKHRLPDFDPLHRFGLKWKAFVLRLEQAGYGEVTTNRKTLSNQVRFSSKFS